MGEPRRWQEEDVEESNFEVEAFLTTKEESKGCMVLDSGATEGVGSMEALDALQEERLKQGLHTDMVLEDGKTTRFRFGNGETRISKGEVKIGIETEGKQKKNIKLKTLDLAGKYVPLLGSVNMLKRMDAVVDFGNGEIIMPAITGTRVLKLKEAKSGHLMLDLVGDLREANKRTATTPSRLSKVAA